MWGRSTYSFILHKLQIKQNKFCNVDMLILKGGKIRAIMEIEESDIKPVQICRKFLVSALSKYFIHDG